MSWVSGDSMTAGSMVPRADWIGGGLHWELTFSTRFIPLARAPKILQAATGKCSNVRNYGGTVEGISYGSHHSLYELCNPVTVRSSTCAPVPGLQLRGLLFINRRLGLRAGSFHDLLVTQLSCLYCPVRLVAGDLSSLQVQSSSESRW